MNGQDFLKKLKKMGITQARVAQILEITPQAVSCMRYSASVKTNVVEKIANAIGSTVSELISERPDNTQEVERLRKEVEMLKSEMAAKNATIEKLIGIIEKMQ